MSKDYMNTEYDNKLINGNSVDIEIDGCNSDIKADIIVSDFNTVRLWGQVKTCNGQPVAKALIKLLKVVHKQYGCEYQGIAHTVSDCKGFYQFDLCPDEIGCSYKILVSKAIIGCDKTYCQERNCDSCENSHASCDDCNCNNKAYDCRPVNKKCNCS